MYHEVNFVDIVAISTLEVCYPPIYEWIKNNKSILTGDFLAHFLPRNKTTEEWKEHYEAVIHQILISYSKQKLILIPLLIVFLIYSLHLDVQLVRFMEHQI
jgi:predicted KAP-like P-loop ATPase